MSGSGTGCRGLLTDFPASPPHLSSPVPPGQPGRPGSMRGPRTLHSEPGILTVASDIPYTLLVLASFNSISPHSQCSRHACLLTVPLLPMSKHMHLRIFEPWFSLPKTKFPKTLVQLLPATTHVVSPPGWLYRLRHTPPLTTILFSLCLKPLFLLDIL